MADRGKKIERVCLECGRVFMARKRSAKDGRGNYCSRSCASKVKARNNMLSHPPNGEGNPHWKGGTTMHSKGYELTYRPEHPRSHVGYVPTHILVMEEALGRLLSWKGTGHPESEIVHHRNGDKTDNCLENLEITTFSEHTRYHARARRAMLTA